jgi:hypothetical protein
MLIYLPAERTVAGRYKPIILIRNEILCVFEKKKSVKKKFANFLPSKGEEIFNYELKDASSISINAVSRVRIEFILPRVVGSTVLAKNWALLIRPL